MTWYYAGTGTGMNIDTITGQDTNIHASTRMYTSFNGKHGIALLIKFDCNKCFNYVCR